MSKEAKVKNVKVRNIEETLTKKVQSFIVNVTDKTKKRSMVKENEIHVEKKCQY